MRNTTRLLGIALFASLFMSFTANTQCQTNCDPQPIDGITYIESIEDVVLGFDTAQYLPENFNAYEGMGADLTAIVFIENEDEVNIDFNTAKYLPIGFDAYEGMEINLCDIEYIEEEETISLDFNAQNYLPNNFNAYSR